MKQLLISLKEGGMDALYGEIKDKLETIGNQIDAVDTIVKAYNKEAKSAGKTSSLGTLTNLLDSSESGAVITLLKSIMKTIVSIDGEIKVKLGDLYVQISQGKKSIYDDDLEDIACDLDDKICDIESDLIDKGIDKLRDKMDHIEDDIYDLTSKIEDSLCDIESKMYYDDDDFDKYDDQLEALEDASDDIIEKIGDKLDELEDTISDGLDKICTLL